MNKLPEAKAIMEKQAKENPTDKEARYYLGVITQEISTKLPIGTTLENALKSLGDPIKIDKTTTASGVIEWWSYDNIYLWFENGKLAGYNEQGTTSAINSSNSAIKWFEEAVAIDPKYFEPHIAIAEIVIADAKKVKTEMNNLGNSKDDFKKKLELDKIYQDKLRVALPYWESCEKLSPDDAKVLDTLYLMYFDLEMTAQATRIEKRMKTLGLLD